MMIQEIMTPTIATVPLGASIQSAAERMEELDVGFLPVQEDDAIVGLLTDRDLVVRAVARGVDPATTPVAEIMTHDMWCLPADRDVEEAAELMAERQIRRLLVLDSDRRLVGVVSLGDLAVHAPQCCRSGEVLERVSEPAAPVAAPDSM
jgi:CBS domain-containing protein